MMCVISSDGEVYLGEKESIGVDVFCFDTITPIQFSNGKDAVINVVCSINTRCSFWKIGTLPYFLEVSPSPILISNLVV